MAWKLKYRCKACGYEAEVYDGRGLFRQQITAMSVGIASLIILFTSKILFLLYLPFLPDISDRYVYPIF